MQLVDATWVVREHKIEYLLPAFVNEEIEIRTCGEYAFHLRVYFSTEESGRNIIGQ